MSRITNPLNETLARWLFAMTLIGYPVAGLIATLMNWDSTLTSIPFRAGVVMLALVLWWRSPPLARWWRHHRWLMLFLLLYLVRLSWDWAVADVPGAAQASVFFLLTVLLPCAAVALAAPAMRERPTALLLVAIGGTVCAAAVLIHLLGLGLGMGRSLTEQTGRLSFQAVNPITLGHVAVTTLIASLCLTRLRPGVFRMGWVIVAALAAGACLLLSASRGPALALALCMLMFVLVTGRWRWVMLIMLLLVPAMLNEGSELWLRFAGVAEDKSTSERLLLQGHAISQFMAHPLFGSVFVDPDLLTYPHNLFIETAMALGVVGLVALMLALVRACLRAIKQLHQDNVLVPLLFVQNLIAAQLSSSIYGGAGLWMTTALLVSLTPYATPKRARALMRAQSPDNPARSSESIQSS